MRYKSLIATLLLLSIPAYAERLPNVVLLIGDDHGYPYFGFMGDREVVTPTMDAIAAGGVTFTQGHASAPYCRPSLRTIITGLHPVQYQVRLNAYIEEKKLTDGFSGMSRQAQSQWMTVNKAAGMKQFDTLPKLLREKGYVSWQGGKWWENTYENGHFDAGMTSGWDMSKFGTDEFFEELMGADGTELVRETMDPLYTFIDEHQSKPMFIWFGPSLPHWPFDAPYKYMKFYAGKDLSNSTKHYFANITWWDDGVSQLMDHIESRGLLEDTLFIFLSDNGWEQPHHEEYLMPDGSKDAEWHGGGFRGKGGMYDQSVRTPIMFYWKDRLTASLNESSLVSAMDLVPTILDIAGVNVPEDLSGYSLKPLLEGRDDLLEERTHLIGYTNNRRSRTHTMGQPAEGYYLRTHRWHFLWYADTGEMRLYDVTSDPFGDTNISNQRPELVAEFKAKILAWKIEMGMPEAIDIHE